MIRRLTRVAAVLAVICLVGAPLAAYADDWSFTTVVTDPPPMQITREGRTYYLAHFNAHRAVYSPRRPPAEPPPAG